MLFFRSWSSAARFSAVLTFWAACAAATLLYTVFIVARLDIAFFEANGMIQNAELRSAFYYQIFELDLMTLGLLALGLAGVSAVSYLFAQSQTNYFRKLSAILHHLANTGEAPMAKNMGNFTPYIERWLNVTSLRMRGEKEDTVKTLITGAIKDWPPSPRVSWSDLAQFVLGSAALACLFAVLCLTFFLRVNQKVVDLAHRLVRFSSVQGPQFLHEQAEIVTFVAWTVLFLMLVAFSITGYRYGKLMANSSYSILRDLRRFMEGNTKQRLLLRSGDLGKEHVPSLNKALDKIAGKI